MSKSVIKSVGGTKAPAQTSSRHHMEIGSGSRPTPSKHKIPVSAPPHAKHLGGRGSVSKALS